MWCEFGQSDLALEPLDLNEVAREVLGLLSNDLECNRVVLDLRLDEALPSIAGVRIQLQQVMLNLIRNASEANDDHGATFLMSITRHPNSPLSKLS